MSEMRNKPVGWQTNIAEEKTREFEEQLKLRTTQDKTQKKESKKKKEYQSFFKCYETFQQNTS